MIVRRPVDEQTDVTWATPSSGYGHVADEQPLPYVHRAGIELTPRFGGEESSPGCRPEITGLPSGVLAQPWPVAQRVFNLSRRTVNRYWRNLLRSRTPRGPEFLFIHQLDFRPIVDGYIGTCPLLRFRRQIGVADSCIRVDDDLLFRRQMQFSVLDLVVVPLFPDWRTDREGSRRLECDGFRVKPLCPQESSAGCATVWVERLVNVSFGVGDRVKRRYTYRWSISE